MTFSSETETLGYLIEEIQDLREELQSLRSEQQGSKEASDDVVTNTTEDKPNERALTFEKDTGDDEDVYELPQDVFTMMFFAPATSISFVYGWLVFASQMMILGCIMTELLQDEAGRDQYILNFAEEVPWGVRAAQVLAVVIAVVSQDDCLDTFNILVIGYVHEWNDFAPGATYVQFLLMNFLRCFEGFFVIFVSFVFIVQADNALDLFLNFAAMEFVASLDNLAFDIAACGWLLPSMYHLTDQILSNKVFLCDEEQQRILKHPILRRCMLFAVLLSLFFGLYKTIHRARMYGNNGFSPCESVSVIFGDEVLSFQDATPNFSGFPVEKRFIPESSLPVYNLLGSSRPLGSTFDPNVVSDLQFSFFSGEYVAIPEETTLGCPVYYERGFNDITSGKFYYCEAEQAWVFTIEALARAGLLPPHTTKVCGEDGWLARSPRTISCSLIDVPGQGWRIWTGKLVEAVGFSTTCTECFDDFDCGVQNGQCVNRRCVCEDAYGPPFCLDPVGRCDELARYFPGGVSVGFAKGVKTYGKPSYSFVAKKEFYMEFVFYAGTQWYDVTLPSHALSVYDEGRYDVPEAWEENFSKHFHSFWSSITTTVGNNNSYYFSEKTSTRTPTGGALTWFQQQPASDSSATNNHGVEPTNMRFECLYVDCTIDMVCGTFGTCRNVSSISLYGDSVHTEYEGGQCVCRNNVTGHFCEYQNQLIYQDGIIVRTFDLDPFQAPCAGPFVDLVGCTDLLYPSVGPGST